MLWSRIAVAVLAIGATGRSDAAPIDDAPVGKPPVILIPGFTGCSIEAKLDDKPTQYPFTCPKTTPDWDVLWLDDKQLTVQNIFCFAENMESQVVQNSVRNFPGVSTRPRDFGGVEGLMYQDVARKIPSFYKNVVEYFSKSGWRVGENLFGAPYDWRYAGVRSDDFFTDLTHLIEETYRETGMKVTLFAHSMGPSVTLYFLRSKSQSWKDNYIAAFLPIVPVWSGNVVSVWNAVSGLDCKAAWGSACPGGESALGKQLLREIGTNIPSMYWTFPYPGNGPADGTWDKDEVIIKTKTKTYTAYDASKMLIDLNLTTASRMQEVVEGMHQPFDPPLVDTYVFYGTAVPTPSAFNYNEDFKAGDVPKESKIEYNVSDNGDGVVPLRSALRSNLTWPALHEKAGKVLEHKAYRNMVHTKTDPVLPDIVKLLNDMQAEWQSKSQEGGADMYVEASTRPRHALLEPVPLTWGATSQISED